MHSFTLGYLIKKSEHTSLVQSVLMNQELLKFTEQNSEEPFCISQNNAGRGRSLGLITWYLPLTGFCFTGITAGRMSQIMSRRRIRFQAAEPPHPSPPTFFFVGVQPPTFVSLSIRRFWGKRGKMEANNGESWRRETFSSPPPASPV